MQSLCGVSPYLPTMPSAREISSRYMRFQWRILDFYKKMEQAGFDYMNSPPLRYEGTNLYISIRVKDKYNSVTIKDVSLYIRGENRNILENVVISLGFCTTDRKELKILRAKGCFGEDEIHWGPFKFCVDFEKILTASGSIDVFCYMKKDEYEESEKECIDSEKSAGEIDELRAIQAECCASLYKKKWKLCLEETLCDVNLIVGEKCYKAHSSVLSCRSPVFYEMLKDHPESLHLEDCGIDVFKIFLEFLYLGRIEDPLPTNAFMLYRQAHLYRVSILKKQCLDVLHRHLSVNTICDVLRLAKQYQVTELLEKAKELFMSNYSEIMDREEWIEFLKDDPLLANEIIKQTFSKIEGNRKNLSDLV